VPARLSPTERIRAQIDELFAGGQPLAETLEEAARLSVRLVIQAALEAEVSEFLGRDRYQRDPDAGPGYRNGHQPVEVKTTTGPVCWNVRSSAMPASPWCPGCWARASAALTRWKRWCWPASSVACRCGTWRRRWPRRWARGGTATSVRNPGAARLRDGTAAGSRRRPPRAGYSINVRREQP